jgi:hypothetical protein
MQSAEKHRGPTTNFEERPEGFLETGIQFSQIIKYPDSSKK